LKQLRRAENLLAFVEMPFMASVEGRSMQNKLYVGGMIMPAVALTGVTIWCGVTQSWLMAIAPALLAVGLFRGAWWAWHCEPFAQTARKHVGDVGTSAAVARWHRHRAEREAAAKATTTAHPKSTATPKNP
jgi:hypothetical protein